MIRHTFLDKSCTIVKDNDVNTGMNPVAELSYGKVTSRALIHFDEEELQKLYEEKSLGDLTKVKHILHLTNCMSQDSLPYEKKLNDDGTKERAASFDVIVFKLPKNFDAGRGFDFSNDAWIKNNRSYSTKGCSWYKCATNNPWDEEGVYSLDTLFSSAATDIIIAQQHFDFGNEDFNFDITDWVNDVLKGDAINHGLGIAFAPEYEQKGEDHVEYVNVKEPVYEINECGDEVNLNGYVSTIKRQITKGLQSQEYVGFFTDNTNTYFHPFIETIYDDPIMDDRAQFYIGKTNRLYLYSVIDGEYLNLDEMPTCTIDGISFDVKQSSKGVYYAEIEPSKIEMTPNTIYYDNWSNLAYNGQKMDDIELEFVALPSGKYFNIGAGYPMKDNLVPSLSGIDDMEELPLGEVRRVIVDFRKRYSIEKKDLIDSAEYRIYINDGNKEITVFDYNSVEKSFMSNFFYIHTDDLIPQTYHIDIRVRANGETRQYKDKLRFKVVDDITEYYK